MGEDHPEYATGLSNLAMMYAMTGDYARAEPLLRQVLEIRKKALGEDHPEYAKDLSIVAALYLEKGDNARPNSCQRGPGNPPHCRRAYRISPRRAFSVGAAPELP